ncbi:MAG TPA: tRNA (N6-isopentenyl adenosine(37)-C2)-methylthiotransferase MiaB [Candidatus Deferrimicrobiaceae bacterium]|jgi:tRNA-2-methylthio-N6-dimethylallyladenosine synthase
MVRRVFIETFGCQMNEVDSGRMLSLLGELSYQPTSSRDEADLILLNTCSIREKAAHKVYSTLGALRGWKYGRKGRLLAVGGCLAQQAGEEIRKRAPHVDIVFGTHNIASLPEMVRNAELRRKKTVSVEMTGETGHWDILPYVPEGAVSAMVTIMQGCDNYCAYCVVPYVRGPEISRPAEEIVTEIRGLAERGVHEVVLLGQNVNSYGKKEGEIAFPQLLLRIAAIDGIDRIRFITSHPRDLDSRTIGMFNEIEKLCPHIHLPMQSGSDRILESMGRGYTRADYLSKVDALKRARPGIAFSTDFIVGFPGETEDDFLRTLEVMDVVRYDYCFSFKYSPRAGTAAASMTGMVPTPVADDRLQRLLTLQATHTAARLQDMVGKTVDLLIEKRSSRDASRFFGRTGCYKAVNFSSIDGKGESLFGRIRIEKAGTHSLSGVEV